MERKDFVNILDEKLKLIRTEYNYSQDKMAQVLGISKKTLVEIEKGRSTLGWMGAVTLCTVFLKSEIISMTFGGHPLDIIMALAFDGNEKNYPRTMGGRVWWVEIEKKEKYKIQKNIISQHFRILDSEDRRICSSFDYDNLKKIFLEL